MNNLKIEIILKSDIDLSQLLDIIQNFRKDIEEEIESYGCVSIISDEDIICSYQMEEE
tara:strand:- start:4289 stop:4462 length:174 start_codon:yes stop_codon:yes gene_type:complete